MNAHQKQIALIANAFARRLLADIGPENLETCRKLNASYGPSCPTHDFCDANVTMAEAFEEVTGVELDLQSDESVSLWNAAWGLCRANNYREVAL